MDWPDIDLAEKNGPKRKKSVPWIDLGEVSGEQETDGDIVSASTDQIIGMVIKAMMMMTMVMMMVVVVVWGQRLRRSLNIVSIGICLKTLFPSTGQLVKTKEDNDDQDDDIHDDIDDDQDDDIHDDIDDDQDDNIHDDIDNDQDDDILRCNSCNIWF